MFVIKKIKNGVPYYLKNMTRGYYSFTTSIAEALKFGKATTAAEVGKGVKETHEVVSLENE